VLARGSPSVFCGWRLIGEKGVCDMTGIRLLWLFVRLGILHEFAYRGNLVVQILYSSIGVCGSLAFLAVVFARTETLSGWSPPEMLALWGVFYVLTGLLGTVVQPSLQLFMEDVRQGTFDFTLLRPGDAQVLASLKQVEVWKLVDVGLGIGLLMVALDQLGTRVGPGLAAAFLIALVAGGATIYSCLLLLATLTFWFIRVDNALIVFLTFWEAGRWPVQVYPPWLRATLTFLIPVAFATTVPAEALRGQLTPLMLVGAVTLAGALVGVARWFWCRGIRHYSGASA
jgi:ABC-2 type transport system permease protein